eukprot:5039482-Pleurochrysis_carterae.AAC.1
MSGEGGFVAGAAETDEEQAKVSQRVLFLLLMYGHPHVARLRHPHAHFNSEDSYLQHLNIDMQDGLSRQYTVSETVV